jgi:hypothetical protein
MPDTEDLHIELNGKLQRVLFSADLSDYDRARLGHPARGTTCACPDCSCTNEADMGTPEHPICGCCLADCPDVHGTKSTR